MFRILTIALASFLVLHGPSFAQNPPNEYVWTISSSELDPYATTGPLPVGAPFRLYLWLACSDQGLHAAEMRIDNQIPNLFLFGFTPRNGAIVVPTTIFPDLRIAVPGCPTGPFLVGELTCLLPAPSAGSVCITSFSTGSRFTVNCGPDQVEHPMRTSGFGLGGAPTCVEPPLACTPDENPPGACCLPDGTCSDSSFLDCAAQGGIYQGAYSVCANVDCATVSTDAATWGRTKAGYR